MNQRTSIPERINDLLGLATVGAGLMLARAFKEGLDSKDPNYAPFATFLRRQIGPGYKLKATYDQERMQKRFDKIDRSHAHCIKALEAAVTACKDFRAGLDNPDELECSRFSSHERAMHKAILIFYEQAALLLCEMQEIRSSVQIIHECEPDPCDPLFLTHLYEQKPPQGAGIDEKKKKEAKEKPEKEAKEKPEEEVGVKDGEPPEEETSKLFSADHTAGD